MSAGAWSSLGWKPIGLKLAKFGSIQETDGSVLEEARRAAVHPDLERGFPVQVLPAEEREPVVVAELVAGIGQAQGPDLERVPAPADVVGVQVPDERRLVVHRRAVVRQVIAAAGGATRDRVETVGPG